MLVYQRLFINILYFSNNIMDLLSNSLVDEVISFVESSDFLTLDNIVNKSRSLSPLR